MNQYSGKSVWVGRFLIALQNMWVERFPIALLHLDWKSKDPIAPTFIIVLQRIDRLRFFEIPDCAANVASLSRVTKVSKDGK